MPDEESSAFWPVHREYELELSEIIDDRIELIKDYAQNYDNLTDEKARELAKKVFAMEKRRTDFKKFGIVSNHSGKVYTGFRSICWLIYK